MSSFEIPYDIAQDALELTVAFQEMSISAVEVIYHRTQLMMRGQMSVVETVAMVMEKATVFADASNLAVMAAARGGDPVSVARAALGPYGVKTRANVERLRL